MSHSLDDYDYKILQHLQSNGRLSNQELAEIVGLSTSQCSRRRITLEQKGMIMGYYAQLHPHAEKQPIMGMIEIKFQHYSLETLEKFLGFVKDEPMIREVYKLTGSYDYVLKVTVEDLEQMSQLINQLMSLNINIGNFNTSIVLERVKENHQMMIGVAHE
ncbi:Lrp/AsnC family transcriptional regulator [Acinetobacter soli]|uniref:Lrp/AsnC family transcriptional regulator n=1 Tax=Acinetobacter soli TaxID=487316 RepID=A0AB38YVN9_9GAMM|nr:Lrp/AsnC family transcriptional regulator [Acinetobacter soli]KQD04332.1 AsnC family transcriptional regulator [Acinetobacter soli]MDQ8940841.1 Lrp/AsnC family transcriptional regulator [Acinetobacter soli]WEH92543.1 Lrp/AsnC family transcriptional regulator [Acinetobacter soli]WEH98281.1 Lrp/AsnC family transcriptional regulator [Acinetobacter soli]WEI01136.1 Lrp/AsnC family transcriptional regulator [Acinetobacter soli]